VASSRCRHPLELFDTAVRGEFKRRSEARAGTWKRAKKYQFLVFLEFLKSSLLKKSFKMTLIIMKSVVGKSNVFRITRGVIATSNQLVSKSRASSTTFKRSPPLLSTNKQTMLRSHLTIVATFSCLLSGAGAASLARHDLSEVSGE
jgi:hypothetical protein